MKDSADRRVAVVIGAGGGLGAALVRQASQNGQVDGSSGAYQRVLPLGRHTQPLLDYTDEASLAAAARWVAAQCAESGAELRLLVVASGFLHGEPGQPERSWAHLDAAYLNHVFAINTIGPALVMKHFLPLLPPMVTLQIVGGRKAKIRAGDVLGVLTGDARNVHAFTREQVGKINVNEFSTYVAVDRALASQAQRKLDAGGVSARA